MNSQVKSVLILCIVFNLKFANASSLQKSFEKLPSSELGVEASSTDLEPLIQIVGEPPKSLTGKSYLTVNKMGFDVLNNKKSQESWILKNILEFSVQAQKPVLDVGCGYGYISLQLLANKKTVIANGLAVEHLLSTAKFAQKMQYNLKNLYLNNRMFPYNTNFAENSLSIVVLHRMLHFLTPDEIMVGFAKIAQWLEPGGKVYIVVMTPHTKDFSDWFLPIYEQRWANGDKWPGFGLEISRALPNQAYNLPQFLHVMDERPLIRALEEVGLTIEKYDYISMQHFARADKGRDGKEAIGIVAVKTGLSR